VETSFEGYLFLKEVYARMQENTEAADVIRSARSDLFDSTSSAPRLALWSVSTTLPRISVVCDRGWRKEPCKRLRYRPQSANRMREFDVINSFYLHPLTKIVKKDIRDMKARRNPSP
jgi:hypothetical protein